jgi:eukaryotic-like serine/threonine-protein kinase
MDVATRGGYGTPTTGTPPAPVVRRSRSGGRTWLWIGATVLAVVIVAGIAGAAWFFNANAQMPGVVGMAPDQAAAVLKTAGFTVAPLVYTPTVSPAVSKGLIVAASSTTGAWVAKGSIVTLTVNGPHMLPVPTVVGLDEADAIAKFQAAGFKTGPVKQEYSAKVPTGKVIAITPAAGAQAAAGSRIALTVSKGVQIVLVPNLVDRDQYAAIQALKDAGLKYQTARAYNDSIQPGNVIGQSPAAGVKTQAGTVVTMTISKGAKPIPTAGVPGVVGDTEATAVSRIQAGGFVPVVKMAPVLPQDAGLIVDQDPVQGKMIAKGSKVTIWVGQELPQSP